MFNDDYLESGQPGFYAKIPSGPRQKDIEYHRMCTIIKNQFSM